MGVVENRHLTDVESPPPAPPPLSPPPPPTPVRVCMSFTLKASHAPILVVC